MQSTISALDVPVIKFVAPSLQANADAFRSEFLEKYPFPGIAYPMQKAVRAIVLRPNSAPWKLLLARKELAIQYSSVERKGFIQNDIGVAVEASFVAPANNHDFEMAALFPKPLHVSIFVGDKDLTFALDTPIPITFVSKPKVEGSEFIPEQVLLTTFIVSNSAITYELHDSSNNTGVLIVVAFSNFIKMDETSDELILWTGARTAAKLRSRGLRTRVFRASSSSCGHGGGGGGGTPLETTDICAGQIFPPGG
jgi:hypothetical protein